MKRIAIAAAAALLMIGSAQAQQARTATSPWYAELGYSFLELEEDTFNLQTRPQALRGIVGYNFHPNFAAEGMLAFGTASDDDRGVNMKLRHSFGLFVKPKVAFNNFEAFARLGWTRSKIRVSGGGATASGSDDDFAYGVGVNYSFNPRTYVGVDWMRYFDKDGVQGSGWTIGVGYRF